MRSPRRALVLPSMLGWLLSVAPAFAAGASVETADPEQKSAAQKTFEAADGLFEAGRFDEAKAAYRASYEIVSSPNSLLMEARCARELGRLGEAFALLEQTLELAEQGAGRYAQTASAARDELGALMPRVGFVTITLPDAPERTWVEVDGRRIETEALRRPVPVTPGERRILARAPDGQVVEKSLSIDAHRKLSQELRFRPAPPAAAVSQPLARDATPRAATPAPARSDDASDSGSLRTFAYVAAGAGVAGFAAFGIFGAMNNSTYSDLEASCPDARCAADREADIDRGRRYQLFANVGLGVGIAGVATGATLFLLSSGSESNVETAILPNGVSVRGRF